MGDRAGSMLAQRRRRLGEKGSRLQPTPVHPAHALDLSSCVEASPASSHANALASYLFCVFALCVEPSSSSARLKNGGEIRCALVGASTYNSCKAKCQLSFCYCTGTGFGPGMNKPTEEPTNSADLTLDVASLYLAGQLSLRARGTISGSPSPGNGNSGLRVNA